MIYERLIFDNKGQTFIPDNAIEGADKTVSAKFWNQNKSIYLIAMGVTVFAMLLFVSDFPFLFRLIVMGLYITLLQYLVRLLIFEEKRYRNALEETRKYAKTKSSKLWGIVFENEQGNGTSVSFADGSIGCFLRLDRGSIVGQPQDYIEMCDSIFSDFLLSCHKEGYYVKICETMESAGKDIRLKKYLERINSEENKALKDILKMNYDYMKTWADRTFYYTFTLLVYTKDPLKLNTIIDDVARLSIPLLQGAFINKKILNLAEIVDLHLEVTNTGAFDIINAKTEMFDGKTSKNKREFKIKALKFKNGNEFQLDEKQQRLLNTIYNKYIYDKNAELNIVKQLTASTINRTRAQEQQVKPVQPNKPVNAVKPQQTQVKPKSQISITSQNPQQVQQTQKPQQLVKQAIKPQNQPAPQREVIQDEEGFSM